MLRTKWSSVWYGPHFNTNADGLQIAPPLQLLSRGRSTIMSYNGVCSPDNIAQAHLSNNSSDPIFHSYSFEQAAAYLEGVAPVWCLYRYRKYIRPWTLEAVMWCLLTPLYVEGQLLILTVVQSRIPGSNVISACGGSVSAMMAPFLCSDTPPAASRYLPQLEKVVSGD